MKRELSLCGRLWILARDGDLISDIDTDMIYHNAHLAVTEIAEMGQHAFGNLTGFETFPSKVSTGDILLAGENFGSGSSRQHAVDCFKALGVQAIVARSFGAIYKRNAINSGFPILEAQGIPSDLFMHMGQVELGLETGLIRSGDTVFRGRGMSQVAKEIYLCGDLFTYAESLD